MPAPAPTATTVLSEAASKDLLGSFGVPFVHQDIASTSDAAVNAAESIGYPVVLKLNGDGIAHKTERGLVRLDVTDAAAAEQAARELLASATEEDGEVNLLVAPMLRATRELIVGLNRDDQFGMTILLGVGGILAEAVADVAIRLVPIDGPDAHEMIDDLATTALFGEFRGEPPVNSEALVEVLLALSSAGTAHPEIVSADVNPLMIVDGTPIAVDALVELER